MGGYADSPVDPIQLLEAIIESIPKCNDEMVLPYLFQQASSIKTWFSKEFFERRMINSKLFDAVLSKLQSLESSASKSMKTSVVGSLLGLIESEKQLEQAREWLKKREIELNGCTYQLKKSERYQILVHVFRHLYETQPAECQQLLDAEVAFEYEGLTDEQFKLACRGAVSDEGVKRQVFLSFLETGTFSNDEFESLSAHFLHASQPEICRAYGDLYFHHLEQVF